MESSSSKRLAARTDKVKRMEWEMEQYHLNGDNVRAKEYALRILQVDSYSFDAHFYLSRGKDVELAKKEGLLALQCIDDFTRSMYVLCCLKTSIKDKNKFMEWIEPIRREIAARCGDVKKGEQYIRGVINDDYSFRINALRKDLGSVIKYIRTNGAVPILLTYPQNNPDLMVEINDAIRSIAAKNKVISVDIGKIFSEIRDNDLEKFSKLFVSGGHCTEDGYKIIAQELYETITNSKITKSSSSVTR